jgi:hypothetical protein
VLRPHCLAPTALSLLSLPSPTSTHFLSDSLQPSHITTLDHSTATPSKLPPSRLCSSHNEHTASIKTLLITQRAHCLHQDFAHHTTSTLPPSRPRSPHNKHTKKNAS